MSERLTLQHLRYLVAMDEARTMMIAAKRCGVTPQTLGKQLEKIEELVGFPIREQTPNSTRLNAEGEVLAREMRLAIQRIEDGIALAERHYRARLAREEDAVERGKASADVAIGTPHRSTEASGGGPDRPGGSQTGCTIALPELLAGNRAAAAAAVISRFNVVEAREMSLTLASKTAQGTPQAFLQWRLHGVAPPWERNAKHWSRGVVLFEEAFSYALVSDDDPLAARKNLAAAALKGRIALLPMRSENSLTTKLREELKAEGLIEWRFLNDLRATLSEAPFGAWAFVPPSVGINPPPGFRGIPLEDLWVRSILYLITGRDQAPAEAAATDRLADNMRFALLQPPRGGEAT